MPDISPDAQKALETLAKLYPEINGLVDSTKKLNSGLVEQLANGKKWDKSLNDHIKQINQFNKQNALQNFANALRTGQANVKKYEETLHALDEAIDQLTDTADEAANGAKRKQLEEQRQLIANKIAMSEFNAGVVHTGNILTKSLSNTVAKTTGDFVRKMQGNSSATDVSSGLMNSAVDAAAAGAGAFTGALQNTGSVLQSSTNPKLKGLGTAAQVAGSLLGSVAAGASKLAKFGIEILSKEVEKTVQAFNTTSAAGAMFTDGMTGMRNAALNAGLSVEQFSKIVSENSANLAASGLGVADGAKQVGRVGKILKDSGVQESLLKLGYSFEEQAALTAETAANMRRSAGGKSTDQAIATQTAKYAENLRIISAITGEDAKRKTEEVKSQNQILAFQQELAKKTPEQRAQIDAAMATMTEQERKNLRDRVVLGTVINKEGAIYEATVAGAKSKGEEAYKLFETNVLTAKANSSLNAEYGKQIQDSINGNKSLGVASYVAGGVLSDVGKSMLDSVNQSTTYTAESLKNAEENVKGQKKANDELTTSVINAAESMQKIKVATEEALIGPMKDFAKVADEIITSIQTMITEATGESIKSKESFWEKTKRVGGAAAEGALVGAGAGAAIGGTVGTFVAPAVGTAIGGVGMGTVGAITGGLVGAIKEAFWGEPGKAKGGISIGPTSGYMEKLHGAEAVVPLEGGRSIPVSLNASELIPKSILATLSKAGDTEKSYAMPGLESLSEQLAQQNTVSESAILKAIDNVRAQFRATDQPSLNLMQEFNDLTKFKSTLNDSFATETNKKLYQQLPSADIVKESATTVDFSGITDALKSMVSNIMPTNVKSQNQMLAAEPTSTKTFSDSAKLAESDLNKSLKEQMIILREIKDTLTSSRDLQQQFVYNTYS